MAFVPPAGFLRKRVTFQRESQTPDGRGGFTRVWGGDLTVWGGYLPETGREAIANDHLQSAVTGSLYVRSSIATRAVTAMWRVLIDGIPHQIRRVTDPDWRKRFVLLLVERGVGT